MTTEQQELLARFRRKIARNAEGWLAFLQAHRHDPAAIDRELPNIVKAAQQALAEAQAQQPGLTLVQHAWAHVELRGHLLPWQSLLEQALHVSIELGADDAPATLATQAVLLDQLGEIARALGDNATALARQQAALVLYRRLDDEAGAGRVLNHLSQVHLALADHDAATRCCVEAAALCAAYAPEELAAVHNNWGMVCQQQGLLDAAIEHFEQAAAGFAHQGNRRGQAKALNNQGEVYRRQGRYDDATRCFKQAIALYQQVGDTVHAARTQINLGILHHSQGRTAEALALHRSVEPLFRRLGDRPHQARIANNEGVFLAALGRPAEAQAAYDLAADLYAAIQDPIGAASALVNCAELLLDQGRPTEAQGYLERGQRLLAGVGAVPGWLQESLRRQQARWQAALSAPTD